ncbi:MAG: DNA translocase FtsK, partial [Patescibacteria group bacterium]
AFVGGDYKNRNIGYARAARIMDVLESRGIIGPAHGAKPRDILEKSNAPTAPAASSPLGGRDQGEGEV